MNRKPIIAGNWKMFKTRDEALYFILKVSNNVPAIKDVETVVCAQAPLMRCLVKRQGENLRIGAQNMHYADEGAFTGEISGALLQSYNVDYVILGHSERRKYFHETDEDVNLKLKAALKYEIKPIVCVGENLEERQNNLTFNVLDRQVKKAIEGLSEKEVNSIVIAYEPIWAIGTGKTATAQMADEACGYIRGLVKQVVSLEASQAIRIQYGGSVNPKNIDELLSMPHIDGALIGGASLDPDHFIYMTKAALARVQK
jgi:triosephosphate isomerase (TIM)